jgi:hypothetical protein
MRCIGPNTLKIPIKWMTQAEVEKLYPKKYTICPICGLDLDWPMTYDEALEIHDKDDKLFEVLKNHDQ